MQAYGVHQFVHDECGACHIASVFHKRNKEKQYQDIGQKYDNPANTTNNTVDN